MYLSEFSYILPKELIAQYPLRQRDEARLLVVKRDSQEFYHDIFSNIGKYLPRNSLLVLNDSKVIPARLIGEREKTKGKVEIFLLRKLSDGVSYQALIRPLGRLNPREKIIFNGGAIYAQVIDFREKIVRFNTNEAGLDLEKIGHIPLPPYIKRSDTAEDRIYYQTVFARKPGSVASPTAGLHFTQKLLGHLKKEGHGIAKVTLHVNYATFSPVKKKNILQHKMHKENYAVSPIIGKEIRKARQEGRSVVAVGTTTTRVLETMACTGRLRGETDIFIYPGYTFQMVDILITNFHLPFSTLLMLVYAFGSKDLMLRAYTEAIRKKYRFYSYGDAMVII